MKFWSNLHCVTNYGSIKLTSVILMCSHNRPGHMVCYCEARIVLSYVPYIVEWFLSGMVHIYTYRYILVVVEFYFE